MSFRSKTKRAQQRNRVKELQDKYGTANPVAVATIEATATATPAEQAATDTEQRTIASFDPPISLKEAAERLSMKPDTLRKRAAVFGGVKDGRFWVFPTIIRPES
jgi:hypothetical protein